MPISIVHQNEYLSPVPDMPRKNCDGMNSPVIHILNRAVI